MKYKRIVISVLVIVLVIGLGIWLYSLKKEPVEVSEDPIVEEVLEPRHIIIGQSAEGRDIESFIFNNGGDTHLLFVGGIHGGYEWNSIVLAYQFIDYFKANSEIIPENISVAVIPSLNPDGVYKVLGIEGLFEVGDVKISKEDSKPGRFNAHGVDLNRNFDCKWKPESTWQGNIVSAGEGPFSEPEAEALRDFILENKPSAVIFWHSQSNAVYASECEEGILPETLKIMNTYSNASGYPAVDSFDAYEISGDAEGWLASINIPAVTVELKTHETIEWQKNLAGVKALFDYYR